MMTLSGNGLVQIMNNEGFESYMYPDHKGYSIGFGHFVQPHEVDQFKNGITLNQGRLLLQHDSEMTAGAVNTLIKVSLTQAQFDALVDFTYNEGVGALQHIGETLNTKDYKGAAERMKLYNKITVHGVKVVDKGLRARREREAAAFEG